MIVSETPNRANSRKLQACVLLCAIVVLPLGMAYAQDTEAVGKRLKAAVEAGELTGEQARAMLGVLRKADDAKKARGSDKAKAYLAKVKKELGAAIAAGKISEEDAKKKFEGAAKAIKEKMAAGRCEHDSKRITPEDLSRAGIEIRKAVAAGKLSKEEGRAKMDAMRKMMGEQREGADRKITREDYGRHEAELKKLVAEGRISKEDALARLEGIRKAMRERGGAARPDWEGIKKRIEGAVERGDMTRQEADAKYKELRERMAGSRER